MTETLLRAGLLAELDEFTPLDAARLPVSTISPSAISTLLACPEQYRLSYVRGGKPRRAGGWAVSGTAFHGVAEAVIRAVRAREPIPEAEAVEAEYAKAWAAGVSEEGGAGNVRWGKESPSSQYAIGLRQAHAWVEAVRAGRIVVPDDMLQEEWVDGYLPGIPLRIVGRLDAVSRRARLIRDTKTTSRGTSRPKPTWLVQALVYIALTGFDLEWHIISNTAGGAKLWLPDEHHDLALPARPTRVEAGEGYVRAAYDLLVTFLERYGTEQPWPGIGVLSDSCMWCDVRRSCRWNP